MSEENSEFRKDVIEGLQKEMKHISSKYFYDAYGDAIFQRIMAAPEYYLTNAENEVLQSQADHIVETLSNGADEFEIIELGAGDGSKTKHVLRAALKMGKRPIYRPVDISQNILNELRTALEQELPGLSVQGIQGEYFGVFNENALRSERQQAILFLGSNIGNLLDKQAVKIMSIMRGNCKPNDRVFIGFDLKKDPAKILAAYNDAGGATRDFNMNLLHRINLELGANIDVSKWMHVPVYDPFEGRALSYLVATEQQNIQLSGSDAVFPVRAWEAVHLEISQKYDQQMIASLAQQAGLEAVEDFTDDLSQYMNVAFKPSST